MSKQQSKKGMRSEAGLAYAGILFLLLILSTMALAFLFKVGTEVAATEQRGKSIQAHYLAESAANHAMWRLLNEPAPEGRIRVAHADDDAHEKADTHMEITHQKVELGKKAYCGLRFLNVKIPQGATITYAHVEFKACDSDNEVTHVRIQGEGTDDAARFTATDGDISNRPTTAASVNWNSIPEWTKDESYRTPDLTSVIQAIVDRGGWSSGNAMVIIFRSLDNNGERRAYSYDNSPAAAALLHVEYDGGGISADNVYYMHALAGGRYGYKVRRHTDTTFATIATVGAIGNHVVHQSYVLYVKPDPTLTSCEAEYVEMHQPYTPLDQGSWQVVDLSEGPYYVPARAVLEVAVTNDNAGSEKRGGVRAVGSKLDRRFDLHEAEDGGVDAVVMHVQADSNSQIEYYAESKLNIGFIFLGYWTCTNYVETFATFSLGGGGGTWDNAKLITYGVPPNSVAEMVIVNTGASRERICGARADGSSLDRSLDISEAEGGGEDATSMFVKAGGDDDATVEVYADSPTNIDFYVMGYLSTPPGPYTELTDTLGSPLVDQTWEDADLSGFGVSADAVAQIALANRYELEENYMGLREKGSSLQRDIDLHEAEGGGCDVATIHVSADENCTIEWYHEDVSDNHEYRLLGYWECIDTFGKDLAGHWKLDETSGTTASDSSSNGNDGTLTNMDPATDWVPGRIDGALGFDGGTEYVLVPHDPSLSLTNQLTVAAWIRKPTMVGYDLVLNKGTSGTNQNYWFGTLDDKITFGFYKGGSQEFEFDANLQTGTWYHIAATYNIANERIRVYLNGAEVDNWSTNKRLETNTEDLYIGRSQYGDYWDGKLDDVRIYNRMLDQAEIQALYDAGG